MTLMFGFSIFARVETPGAEAAASDGHQDIVYQGQLLYDLHGNRALAGSYRQVVEGMDEGIAMLLCQPVSMLTGFVVDISVQHHLSAIALGALHLHQGASWTA